jgi:hypothetical protein
MQDIAAIHLNDDEYLDLVIADKQNSRICIILGHEGGMHDTNGTGISDFNDTCTTALKTPSAPEKIIVKDINKDGYPDITVLTANGQIVTYLNDKDEFLTYSQLTPQASYNNNSLVNVAIRDIAVNDVNGNGYNDLILFDGVNSKIRIHPASPNQTIFDIPTEYTYNGITNIFTSNYNFAGSFSLITCNKNSNSCGISQHSP